MHKTQKRCQVALSLLDDEHTINLAVERGLIVFTDDNNKNIKLSDSFIKALKEEAKASAYDNPLRIMHKAIARFLNGMDTADILDIGMLMDNIAAENVLNSKD